MTASHKLRLSFALFFLALAAPAVALIVQAYSRLQWETLHQHQSLAEEFTLRMDKRLRELVRVEDARAFTEYAFYNVIEPAVTPSLQRSPLATFPPKADIPGLIGHFQIDTQGSFSAPFLPPVDGAAANSGLAPEDERQRQALAARMQAILGENRLIANAADVAAVAAPLEDAVELRRSEMRARPQMRIVGDKSEMLPPAQSGFDQLNAPSGGARPERKQNTAKSLGRVEDFEVEGDFLKRSVPAVVINPALSSPAREAAARPALRKERSVLPEPAFRADPAAPPPTGKDFRIRTFESEVDAFDASLLDSGHLVLFRKVWHSGQRYVQGLLIDRQRFLEESIAQPFAETALSRMSDLVVAYRGEVLSIFDGDFVGRYSDADDLRGTLMYQGRLSAPFSDFELVFSVNSLPAGPGGTVIAWLAAVLTLVLCGGTLLMYHLAARQLALVRQQQDFVSAVSHELKTPLTSIRMYGEMLREGWAPQEKRQEYYAFIHDESERLSRLINNVLNLARMTRNELEVDLRIVTVGQLLDLLRSKIGSVVSQARRAYSLECPAELEAAEVAVDLDCFTQIVLNLVDNALKFSARAAERSIVISVRAPRHGDVEFGVRDFGPGIPSAQLGRIFGLFYRAEDALTRETAGTGIGLALVKRLAELMDGRVDAVNCTPGAEFRLSLPRRYRA